MRYYTTPTGERYPLTEARYNIAFKVYRSDRRKAKPGDPGWCLLALGIKRDRSVQDVYIGSGHDAYVIFKKRGDEVAHAVHFVIRTKARKVVDEFDKNRSAKTQAIELIAPPYSWTLDRRKENNTRRRNEIKAGAVAKAHKVSRHRMQRIGVAHRPRPQITKSGSVSMMPQPAA